MVIAALASPIASSKCVPTWSADFRADLPKNTVPTLIIQGTADKVLPFALTGEKLEKLLPNCQLSKIEGAPHGLLWTHSDEVNRALMNFLRASRLEKSVA
jgi:pimeloyl-ACP methyl ester carboxylesterase